MKKLVVGKIHEIYLSVLGCFYMQVTDEAAIFSGVKCHGEEKPDKNDPFYSVMADV